MLFRSNTTVIEKKNKYLGTDGTIHVVADTKSLQDCNKVFCTASTIINDSIDEVLACAGNADSIVVAGPTAGFFPEPLFQRGVIAIGGTEIIGPDQAIENLINDQGFRNAARKTIIHVNNYPAIKEQLKNKT